MVRQYGIVMLPLVAFEAFCVGASADPEYDGIATFVLTSVGAVSGFCTPHTVSVVEFASVTRYGAAAGAVPKFRAGSTTYPLFRTVLYAAVPPLSSVDLSKTRSPNP